MVLRIIADSLDEIPEALRSGATEADGKHVADLSDGWAVEDVGALRTALQTERKGRKDAEAVAKVFEGIDADAARDALSKVQAGGLKSKDEIDAFKREIEAKFANDKSALDSERQKLEQQLHQLLIDNAAAQAINEAGGKAKLLMPILKSAAKVESTDDGTLRVVLTGEDGAPLVTKQAGKADPMGFAEYLSGLKASPDYQVAFSGSGTGGSGASHATGGSGRSVQDTSNLSPEARLARANERSMAG